MGIGWYKYYEYEGSRRHVRWFSKGSVVDRLFVLVMPLLSSFLSRKHLEGQISNGQRWMMMMMNWEMASKLVINMFGFMQRTRFCVPQLCAWD